MRIFVTGLTGFTGSHLAEHLLALGHEVGGLSRSGAWPDGMRPCPARVYRGDLARPADVPAVLDDFAPEVVVHLAAFPAPSRASEQPLEVVRDSVHATVVLFEALRKLANRPAVLVAGSATAYGRVAASDLPIREEQPLHPLSAYGVAKAAQELYAWQYRATDGFRVVVTRTFNSTGPRQGTDFFLPRLCREVARREAGFDRDVPIRVGDLEVQRDFLDVRDVARAYAVLALSTAVEGRPVNVCSGAGIRLADMARMVTGLARVDVRLAPDPGLVPASQDAVVVGDAGRLRALTGFVPRIPLSQTVADVLADQRRSAGGA